MDLNALKAQRKGFRTAFTVSFSKIETELAKETIDLKVLSILRIQLSDKFQRLDTCQTAISEQFLLSDDGEKLFSEDLIESETYRDRYLEKCAEIDSKLLESTFSTEKCERRKFKLPKIELKKFSGEAKDYLTFWSQFQKIHDDRTIPDEDKMQYLLQSMEPKSKAERLILSFPATAANYSKAIEQLKERFGREDLLVQIYVRDLLNLVMKNAASGKMKVDLPALYDELEGKLRSLESLGRTQEKYGDFLTPLVESCLPEEVLIAWERSRNHDSLEIKESRTLEHLMNFLRREVKGEEMVLLARTGFSTHQNYRKKDSSMEQVKKVDVTTAAALVSLDDTGKKFNNCIFCDKSHPSEKCFSAKRMTLAGKKQLLLKKGACFSCLKKAGHLSKFCNVKNQLNCSYCNNPHFDIMCVKQDKCFEQKNVPKSESSLSNCSRSDTVYLQTLCVIVRFLGKEKIIRAVIDTGSQSTYVSQKLMTQLNLSPLRNETVIHALFGGNETKPKQHQVFSVEVSNLEKTFACSFEALTEKRICGFVPKINDKGIFNELKENKIDFTDSCRKESEISLLIGADVLGRLLTGNTVALQSGLTALETKLGWTVFGKQTSLGKDNSILTTLSMHAMKMPLNELWRLETLGISDPTERESYNLNDFEEKMKILPDGRYEVELPWKCVETNLPNNEELVRKRHEGIMRKFGYGVFFENYQRVFEEWESLNIIERVPDDELNKKCHFLSHRPVIKSDSATTKIRPVFDASASERGKPSLNDCLFKGLNLIELIPDILDRFRMYPIGISADIEKAFLMLSVAPKDRDFLRFFFPHREERFVYRHCRVVFGVTSSPFLLNASLMHLLDNCLPRYKEVAQKLKCSFYVDNCITGVFNVDEEELFIEHAKSIMATGNFNLRSFESNVSCKNVDKHSGDTSVLGVIWNLDNDTLRCCTDINALTCDTKITKRLILAVVQKFFDPIGLLTPTTLLPKLLLQDLWKLKIGWDCELSVKNVNTFLKWFKEIIVLEEVTLPRYMVINPSSELHVFVDASKGAYAACVFIRSIINSEIKVTLVRAKSRVAPLKPLSMPRLELMACCIGSRLVNSIVKALNLPDIKITSWSDSTTALWWIKEQGNWSVFVENRVKEIRELAGIQSWRHVPGNMNIADLLSRGCSPRKMMLSRWWEGPTWLRKGSECWPVGETHCQSEEINVERKKTKIVNIDLSKDAPPWHLRNISNYDKMIRVFSWILRFVNNCKTGTDKCKDAELSQLEIEGGERYLLRLVQGYYLSDSKSSNSIETVVDNEGILRVKTRILNRNDEKSFLYPVLLPDKCEFTELLIKRMHIQNCHAGVQILQSIIRENFWIIRARKTIKNVIFKCIACKRFKVKNMLCEPTPLPSDRVSDCVPFEIVGIDLAGPLFLKNGEKVWIALFTCAVYRAIHLELVNSLSTDAFLLALRRFIARRGRPRTIYSDNGSNFRGASNDLSKLNWGEIVKQTRTPKLFWKFIPPTAAWWGGWWERLVRTVKDLLKRTLGKSVLTYEELYTVICDCEKIINSRPLTYVSENPRELIPLTPAMFLTENRCTSVEDIDELDSRSFISRIKYRSKLLNDLRQRFRKEYLGQLVQKHNGKVTREPKIGEIVLVGDDNKKRLFWPLAKIIELIPGRDGKIRTVRLKTQHTSMLRPIQRVFPLEIQADEAYTTEEKEKPGEEESNSGGVSAPIRDDFKPDNVIVKRYTSSGRCVKTPKRLDLFNNVCYDIETQFRSQGGEYVVN